VDGGNEGQFRIQHLRRHCLVAIAVPAEQRDSFQPCGLESPPAPTHHHLLVLEYNAEKWETLLCHLCLVKGEQAKQVPRKTKMREWRAQNAIEMLLFIDRKARRT